MFLPLSSFKWCAATSPCHNSETVPLNSLTSPLWPTVSRCFYKFRFRLVPNNENEMQTRQIHVQTKCGHEQQSRVWEYFTFYMEKWGQLRSAPFGDLIHFFLHSLSSAAGSRMIINNSKRNATHSHRDQISARCKHNSLLTRKSPRTPPLI